MVLIATATYAIRSAIERADPAWIGWSIARRSFETMFREAGKLIATGLGILGDTVAALRRSFVRRDVD